jgi:hypothetical protein
LRETGLSVMDQFTRSRACARRVKGDRGLSRFSGTRYAGWRAQRVVRFCCYVTKL